MKNPVLTLLFVSIAYSCFSQVRLIFDTDMGSDCDDAGALAVLHKLADKEEATILGFIYSSGVFSGLGENITTGNRKLPDTPDENPVKEIYSLWNGAIEKGRHSWDQVAVLVAVRPELFNFETWGSLRQVEGDKTFWDKANNNPRHSSVALKTGMIELELLIEDLMSELPK